MILYFWLILCNLSLVHLKHVPLVDDYEEYMPEPKLVNNKECNVHYLQLINKYFRRTTINRSDSSDQLYCSEAESRHERALPEIDDMSLSQLIDLYRSLPNVNSYNIPAGSNAVTSYGVLPINDAMQIPVYMIANIRRRHIQSSNNRPSFGADVEAQMELMGQLESDERGHLLAHTLGGSSTALNIVPMARNLNRHLAVVSTTPGYPIPRSFWRWNEDWILNFLNNRAHPDPSVSWRIAVQYPGDTIVNPGRDVDLRPVRFAIQFTAYTDFQDPASVYYTTPEMSFPNDNDFGCGVNVDRRSVSFLSLLPQNPKCDIIYPEKPKGLMGKETDHGVWNERYQVSFSFKIGGKQYLYGQSIIDGGNWFIQEFLPDGRMGQKTDHGVFAAYYTVVFPFHIKGRQFFYGHDTVSYAWVIRELLPGGKMGGVTDSGVWIKRHAVSFPFTIDGEHYFFGQRIAFTGNSNWFIQELLPEGRMGQEKQNGLWNRYYYATFPFFINGRQFFYGHSTDSSRSWFIQELLRGGVMGEETDRGVWDKRYKVSVPFKIDGNQYFFGQSILDGTHWFVRELLPNGRMGNETDGGNWDYNYPVVVPFNVNRKQFLYGHNDDNKNWFIQALS